MFWTTSEIGGKLQMKAEEKTTNHKLVTKLIWHLGEYDGEDLTTKIFFDMIYASHSCLHVLNKYGVLRNSYKSLYVLAKFISLVAK